MFRNITLLPATLAAGLISGEKIEVFLAASLAGASSIWFRHARAAVRPCLFVNLDPRAPEPSVLVKGIQNAFGLVRRTQAPILVRITAFRESKKLNMRLGLTRNGDAELSVGSKRTALGQPGVWLPDHPLPLPLPSARGLTLKVEPKGANRFRVSAGRDSDVRRVNGALLALLVVAACALESYLFKQ